MNKAFNAKFDERELKIRGGITLHMFIVTAVCLVINAFLADYDIKWASGFGQNIIILLFATAVGSVEMVIRGVYARNASRVMLTVIFGVLPLPSLIWHLIDFVRGDLFIADGALTRNAEFTIMMIFTFSIGIASAIKLIFDKKRDREAESE